MSRTTRILAVLSLATCLATLAAWPASFYRSATVRRVGPGLIATARVGSGRAGLFWQTFPRAAPSVHPAAAVWSASAAPVRERFFRTNQRWRDAVRFEFTTQAYRTSATGVTVARSALVPLWCPALLTALAPAVAAQRWLTRRRRVARRQCPACGYDLRHSPDRCPECGWTPPVRVRPTVTRAG